MQTTSLMCSRSSLTPTTLWPEMGMMMQPQRTPKGAFLSLKSYRTTPSFPRSPSMVTQITEKMLTKSTQKTKELASPLLLLNRSTLSLKRSMTATSLTSTIRRLLVSLVSLLPPESRRAPLRISLSTRTLIPRWPRLRHLWKSYRYCSRRQVREAKIWYEIGC